MSVIFEIDESGNMHGLYTDEINLFSLGKVTGVRKASNVEFCEDRQVWQVTTLDGQVVHECKNREDAIEWEIAEFSPGGKYYEQEVATNKRKE